MEGRTAGEVEPLDRKRKRRKSFAVPHGVGPFAIGGALHGGDGEPPELGSPWDQESSLSTDNIGTKAFRRMREHATCSIGIGLILIVSYSIRIG